MDAALGATVDAYRTCEFTTLGTGGTPLTWPTAAWRRPDGTFLVTTSLAFAQKARNIRRDGRVALLLSDPTGSGDPEAPQVFVSGTAECPEEIHTGPGEAAEYWRTLFRRQPHSRGLLRGYPGLQAGEETKLPRSGAGKGESTPGRFGVSGHRPTDTRCSHGN
ncbi:pyridoxamine 5'-phosphate oxidase family protein [Streptomyces collinus]|uniref:pyridoxamine 5'-phosphate oxidase family protein n=1 Tax=Streptomyces collinus TaxID=42684 RepID=UPI003326215A